MSIVFEANLDETDNKDFRTPLIKPSAIERELAGGLTAGQNAGPSCDNKNAPAPDVPGLSRCDFINQDPIEAFMQTTPEVTRKLGVSIGNNGTGHAMETEDIGKEAVCNINCGILGATRGKVYLF